MHTDADIAALGGALASKARSAMLLALLGGESITSGELARRAGVSRPTATEHLSILRERGLVLDERRGRHRLFRLGSIEIAEALEVLARVAPPQPVRNVRNAEAGRALKRARTCYDHLAGELGVAVTDALVARRMLAPTDEAFRVTRSGTVWLSDLDIDVAALQDARRTFARVCLDWTERRPHVAGALGAALADTFFRHRWARRIPGGRALALTPDGREWLLRELGVGLP